MRILVVFILLTIFSGSELRAMSIEQESPQAHSSQLIAQSNINYDVSASFHESQIRIADSLYKNYLPQSNFEEVKAAVEFFDSYQQSAISGQRWRFFDSYQPSAISGQRWRLFGKEADDENRLIAESRQLTAAKAHYYHAVGLTEKDDIVGACEHYLTALEIMEPLVETSPQWRLMANDKRQKTKGKGLCDSATLRLCDSNKEDYEKIRFVALIYTRLGRLFLNENYCDLAITKYSKALKHVEMIDESSFKADLLKFLGNSYQLANIPDSALYYYNESLRCNSSLNNKLDVEKNIAQILFYKGERDSAFIMIKNNLDKIENINVKHSYYNILGEMYFDAGKYEKAIIYFEKSINSIIPSIKVTSAINLSSICDSIKDYDKKVYYDNIISKYTIKDINKNVERSKLQYIYNNYKERKLERDRFKDLKKTFFIILSLLSLLVLTFIVAMSIKRKYKIKHIELSSSLNNKEIEICIKNEVINQIKCEIEVKEKQLQELKFKQSQIEGKIKNRNVELQKKDDIIKKCEIEISELKSKLERGQNGVKNIEKYLSSEVCLKILNEIKELSDKNIDTSELSSLEQGDFVLLLNSANQNFNNLINNIASIHTKLKKEDLYYVCLIIIGLNDKQISSLFGVTYTAINKRRNKISNIIGVDIKEYMYKHIQNII